MEVTITQFRKDPFTLVEIALYGGEVWVSHKGRRVQIVPEGEPQSKLSRIRPMHVLNPDSDESWETALKEEMRLAWEKDWEDL